MVFLDVGQGDAILIESDTFNVLIDAGHSRHIMRDLLARRIHHISLLIASHNHDDHIGDMDDVVRNMRVDAFIDNTCPETSDTYRNLHNALRRYGVPQYGDSSRTIQLGKLSLQILSSPFTDCSNENNVSIGVIVRFGHFSALLTGDSQIEEENAWAQAGAIPDVDVLKAAHHGAENGAAPFWLSKANPEVIVISVGPNIYGHPSKTALRRYATHDRQIYRTDFAGTITLCITPDGDYEVWGEINDPGVICSFASPAH